jgi:tetratricopeptide (TPR) repeat protein
LDDAVTHYERALVLEPDNTDAGHNLGLTLMRQGKMDEAIACFRRVLTINRDHPEAHAELGNIFRDQGNFDDAMAHYGRAIAIRPGYAEAHFNRAAVKTFQPGEADLAALEKLAADNDLPASKAPFVHFALAKALEDSGDYDRAFEHLRKGNDLKRRQIEYDEAGEAKLFERISAVFDRGLLDGAGRKGDPSPVPIFVLSMPRSGSSLIEQILASHPQVHGAGELDSLDAAVRDEMAAGGRPARFPECVPDLDEVSMRRLARSYLASLPNAGEGQLRIVDKMPGNFLKVGLIRLILPNARIIHSMRDPIDTCFSCYSKLFAGQPFSYDLAELGRYYRRYRELMAHWQAVLPRSAMLEVSYEDVVDDLEGQARRLIEYCGLPWDDRCLSFHKASRAVRTHSAVQVRKPLFRSSLQRWRRFEACLGPLLRELGDLAPASVEAR